MANRQKSMATAWQEARAALEQRRRREQEARNARLLGAFHQPAGKRQRAEPEPEPEPVADRPAHAVPLFRTDAAGNRIPPRRIELRPMAVDGASVQSDWTPFRRAEPTAADAAMDFDRPRPIVLPEPRAVTFVPNPRLLLDLQGDIPGGLPQAALDHYATLVRKYMELIKNVDLAAEAAANWKRTVDALARMENEERVKIYTQSQYPYRHEEADRMMRRQIQIGLLDGTVRLDEHGRVIMDPGDPSMPLIFDAEGEDLVEVDEPEIEQENRVLAAADREIVEVLASEDEAEATSGSSLKEEQSDPSESSEDPDAFVLPVDACWARGIGNAAPYLHQMAPARFVTDGVPAYNGMLLAHMTGEGKTIAAITAVRCLVAKLERRVAEAHAGGGGPPVVVMVVTTKSTLGDWRAAIAAAGMDRQSIVVTHALFSPGKYGPDRWDLNPEMAQLLGVRSGGRASGGRQAQDREVPDDQAEYADGGHPQNDVMQKLRPIVKSGAQLILVVDEAHLFRPLARANERVVGLSATAMTMLTWAQHAQFVVTATATPLQANPLDLVPMLACSMAAGDRAAARYRLPARRPPLDADAAIQLASALVNKLNDGARYKDQDLYTELYGTVSVRNLPFPDLTKPRAGFPDVFWTLPLLQMDPGSARRFDETREIERGSTTRGFRLMTRKAPPQKLDWMLQKVKEHFFAGQTGLVYFEFVESATAFAKMLQDDPELTHAVRGINADDDVRGGWYRAAINEPAPASSALDIVDIITGDTAGRGAIIRRFNTGRLGVLIITRAGSVGVSLLGCRYVIIGEEFFQRGLIDQCASRAIRSNSHARLPREDRTVHVYEPVMIRQAGPGVDLTDRSLANFSRFFRRFKDIQTSDGDAIDMALRMKDKLDLVLKRLCKRASLEKKAMNVSPCKGPVEAVPHAQFIMLGKGLKYRQE